MEFDALTMITEVQQQHRHQLPMRFLRGLFHLVKIFHLMVLSCTLFCLATCGPCLIDGMQKSLENDAGWSCKDDHAVVSRDIYAPDSNAGYVGSSISGISIKNICTSSHSFCFPSTLPGFSSKEHKSKAEVFEVSSSQSDNLSSIGSTRGSKGAGNRSWFSDSGMFELINGQTVACSLNSMEGANQLSTMQTSSANQNDLSSCRGPLLINRSTSLRLDMNSEMRKSSIDASSSPHVEISPPVLDYGHKHLYFPSVSFLTVTNMGNDNVLHVYEPFSTNLQFYPCNFSELFIRPGEAASICFVFLPRWLGLSSAHLILQTSSGGFLVQVKGYAVESPYKISPVVSLDTDSSGHLSKNLSLFNPFNENLYVKEISAWISLCQGNISYHAEATCRIEKFQDPDGHSLRGINDRLVVNSGQVGFPVLAFRPYDNWEIHPRGNEPVVEIEFSFESEAQIVGAFCMQLIRSSHDKTDTIFVPVEIDLDGKFAYDGIAASGAVSASLEALVPYDTSNTVVAISLRNGAPYLLSIVKINEVAPVKGFQIKYVQGLLLFPGTITQVATVACSQLFVDLHDSSPELSNVNENCKLVVLTNDSSNPRIEIPCRNIINICLSYKKDSSIGIDLQSEKAQSSNRRSGLLSSETRLPSRISALETVEADEFVLENWKSQGTSRSMSVLDDREVLFSVVQVGTQQSKWITVKNPSEQPVVMQLILNSGEIIDECRGTDIQPLLLGSLVHNDLTKIGHGFSMADGARTEAYVHPYGKASFGPIFFHPSNRCGWTSSALIRNNLSGVEWLPLKGYGGLLSLVLFEGSEPLQSIEFNLNLPFPLNISSPDLLDRTQETARACSEPLSKELYAKNIGDLPLEVKSIEVSGTECALDGFMVHNCNGFSLEPGASIKLIISYQSDFYAAVLQRDLELTLASGILVLPMKASMPLYMLNACKKSVLWMRLKKFSAVVLLSASLMFLIFCCVFPQVINFSSQDYFYKSEETSITTVRSSGKSPRLHRNQRNNKFSLSREVDSLLKSVVEGKTSEQTSGFKYSGSQLGEPISVQNGVPTPENHKQVPSSLSKSVPVENSNAPEASEPCNLTVRIGKERGRRRRKRKGVAAGLAGLFEVSSSQSGNSTPSSPLSPTTSGTPNRNWSPSPDMDLVEARNPFIQANDQQSAKAHMAEPTSKTMVSESTISINCSRNNSKSAIPDPPSVSRKASTKPVLLTSATFPSPGKTVSSLLYSSSPASTSPIAPHARAPGPKIYNQKKVEEKVGSEYVYDIWGDHFSGLHLVGSSKDVTTMKTVAKENSSSSFFLRGPQALVTKSQPQFAGCSRQED